MYIQYIILLQIEIPRAMVDANSSTRTANASVTPPTAIYVYSTLSSCMHG